MCTITIQIPDELRKELDEFSRQEGVPFENAAGECVRRFLACRRLEEIQKELAPYAKAAGFETEKDFFRDIS